MRLAAFDPSLTAIGWARTIESPPTQGPFWESGVINPRWDGPRRLWDALHRVLQIADGCDVALIEGYAHQGYRAHQLGELGGVLRLGFYQKKIPYLEIAPTKVKKFATGKGSGKKEPIFAECIRRLGYGGNSPDESDALWILHFGIHGYGLPGAVELPKHHLAALEGIEWPQPVNRRR